jgi:hypothetical protein
MRRRRPLRKPVLWMVLGGLLAAAVPAVWAQKETGAEWRFTVLLDGKPIGRHVFHLEDAANGERVLRSDAEFSVELFGITVYRYRHAARERWRESCLVALQARTDDDERVLQVQGERRGDAFVVDPGGAATGTTLPGCAMSFAYWHPALRSQTRLVNPQTGQVEAVTVTALAPTPIDVRGRRVEVEGFRIAGAGGPIDVWTSAQGAWIGLDAAVGGGRRLSYRLR